MWDLHVKIIAKKLQTPICNICYLVHVILLSRPSCDSNGGEAAGLPVSLRPVRDSPGTPGHFHTGSTEVGKFIINSSIFTFSETYLYFSGWIVSGPEKFHRNSLMKIFWNPKCCKRCFIAIWLTTFSFSVIQISFFLHLKFPRVYGNFWKNLKYF